MENNDLLSSNSMASKVEGRPKCFFLIYFFALFVPPAYPNPENSLKNRKKPYP